jgi:hypothetical protein
MPPWSWSFARARAGAHASLPVNALASPPASPSTRANAGGPQKPRSRVASVARGAAIVALCVAAIAALYHLASPTIAEAIGDAARRQRAAAYVSEKLTVFGEAPSLLGPLEKNQTRFTTQSVSSTALPSSTLPPGVLARELRAVFLIPFLQACVATTAFLSSLVAADRMFHVYVAAYWRLCSRKDPVSARWRVRAPMPDPQTVTPDTVHLFPTVVVQLPMFNEKEVCEHVIDAACALEYPRSRILVQILDDSTCSETRRRIEHKVFYLTLVPVRRRSRGERRSLRTFAVASLHPSHAFNPRPRRLSPSTDAFELHPDIIAQGVRVERARGEHRVPVAVEPLGVQVRRDGGGDGRHRRVRIRRDIRRGLRPGAGLSAQDGGLPAR